MTIVVIELYINSINISMEILLA